MHSIGFICNALEGTTQVILWDEDSKALRFKDSDEMNGAGFLKESVGYPAPEDVYTEQVKNVPVRKQKYEDVC